MIGLGMRLTMPGGTGKAALTITNVSQSAGTIDGGSTVTVDGIGFEPAMTAPLVGGGTFGTVTYVNSSRVTIATGSHAAGSIQWTLRRTSDGSTSPAQNYTYLAHPSFTSISPTSGPQTIASTGVVVTLTGLPASGTTGCPLSVTVDGNACSAVTWTSTTTLTCTVPTDTTSGAKNVVVSVDGITTTGAGAWTYNPPPIDISATNVSTNGGTGTITGQNFVNGCTASVNINGTPKSLTITFVSSTKLTFALAAGSYTAGTWNLTVTNPDTQSDTQPIFQIANVSDPQTILGANLFAWYRADSGITTSGGLVTQWNDKGANAINLTASGTQRPTFNAASSNGFNAMPTVTFDGVANTMLNTTTAVTLGTNTAFVYVIGRWAATTTSTVAAFVQATGTGYVILQCVGAAWQCSFNGQVAASKGSISTSAPAGSYGYVKGTGASTETVGCNTANIGENTQAGAITEPSSSGAISVYLGSRASAAGTFGNIEIAEVIYSNTLPNATQLNQLYAYANFQYGLDSGVSFTRATNVLATTGTEARIAGSGFNSTTGVQVVVGGTPTSLTTSFLSASSVSISGIPSLSAGQYDLIITNASSSSSLFVSNALNVTATKQPDTIFGRNCIVWNRLDQVASFGNAGTTVASLTDLACAGWSFAQATAANQPAYNATDSNFSNLPSASFTGSPILLAATGGVGDQNNNTQWWLIICKPRIAAAGFLATQAGSVFRVSINGGVWSVSAGGSTASGGSSGTVHSKVEWRSSDAGGGNEVLGCALNFGTEGTVSQAGNVPWSGAGTIYLANNQGGASYGQYDIAEVIGLDVVPSGSKLTDLQTYASRYF